MKAAVDAVAVSGSEPAVNVLRDPGGCRGPESAAEAPGLVAEREHDGGASCIASTMRGGGNGRLCSCQPDVGLGYLQKTLVLKRTLFDAMGWPICKMSPNIDDYGLA